MTQNERETKENFKGIFISSAILQDRNLKADEKIVYALIHHYTANGEKHACYLTNERISEITGINYYTLRDRVRPKLKEKGYISTNGGIRSVSREQQNHDTPNSKNTIQRNIKKEEKEIYILPTITLRDSHQSEPDRVNNNPLGGFEIVPDIPEWMNELKPVEPFEQYTDDIQGEPMEKTTNEPLQADERENDPVTDNLNKITSSDEGIDGENAVNGLGEALGVSPTDIYDEETENEPLQENETSKLDDLSNERGDGGTTTHGKPESLPNGEKTTSTGATEPETDNVNNNFIIDRQSMNLQERKEKQAELSRKWVNFKQQVPQMHRADAEMYFKRFLNKVSEYYTGTHINTTQERYMREFNALKPLADWNEQEAAQDIENWISQGYNPDTIKRYLKQKYGEEHDEFVMQKRHEHYSRPIKVTPEYAEWEKNPVGPAPLPF